MHAAVARAASLMRKVGVALHILPCTGRPS